MVHILLIQYDPSPIAEQVRRAFPAPLNRVELARTQSDALARLMAGPPDVVLLDFTLPDRTALDLFQEIRAVDARVVGPGDFAVAGGAGVGNPPVIHA